MSRPGSSSCLSIRAQTGFSRWLCGVGALLVALFGFGSQPMRADSTRVVHVYCAQDQVYAEPIFEAFHRSTGIRVLPVFDSEAVKTVGLANRLIAERRHPVADVYWGNEELRARQLAAMVIFRETNGWTGFGQRSRRIVYNPQRLASARVPKSVSELTNSAWNGRLSLAFPGFGSTATHFLALRQAWGEARWQTWCRALAANKPYLEEGNSQVVRRVARGEAWIGLTDSDDIAAGIREGLSVAMATSVDELMVLPNTVAVVRECPHEEAAQALYMYLQQRAVTGKLVEVGALESTLPDGQLLQPDWPAILRDLDRGASQIRRIFRP